MARKSVGYVELQWTCPNCGTKNMGTQRVCTNCGTPQPDEVKFEQPNQTEFIKDEDKLAKAKVGPDIHCYYCGTRNPAGTTNCSQCGADLTEGKARTQGQLVGTYSGTAAKPVICPSCGTENQPNAAKCVQCGAALAPASPQPTPRPTPKPAGWAGLGLFGILGIGLLGLCAVGFIIFMIFSFRSQEITGQVQSTRWERSIAVEELVPVTAQTWRDEVPSNAIVSSCALQVHHTQDQPAPNAEEICGTPYVVDEGSGFGEVVQDCRYEVYEQYCDYTVEEWRQVDSVTVDGEGFSAQWPSLAINNTDQREGERAQTYRVIFDTEQGPLDYTTSNLAEYQQYQVGSRWVLEVNGFNTVVSAKPAN